jgi:hypothetical protein
MIMFVIFPNLISKKISENINFNPVRILKICNNLEGHESQQLIIMKRATNFDISLKT